MTATAPVRHSRTSRLFLRLAITSLVLAAAMTAVGPASHPKVVNAATAEYVEGLLVKWINAERTSRGIPALRIGSKLTTFAGDRAKTLASNNKLAHPSCLSCMLRQRGVSFSVCAEVIAGTTYPWGYDAARSIFRGWKSSSGHWSILMSRSYTRMGIGVAYRSSNHTTFAAGVLVR
jgi:uncharacterized protein YkwD